MKSLPLKSLSPLQLCFLVFFWLFNASLLIVAYFGLLPLIGFGLIGDAFAGLVPFNLFLPFVGLVGVPTACTVVGLRAKRAARLSLVQLFWGIEAPLLLFCTLRFFWLRDLTPGTTLLLLTGLFGVIAYGHWAVQASQSANLSADSRPADANPDRASLTPIRVLHLTGLVLVLLLALYGSALVGFYLVPFGWAALQSLTQLPVILLYSSLLLPLLLLVAGLLLAPLGAGWTYGLAWWRLQQEIEQGKRRFVWLLSAGVVTGWLVLFVVLHQSPQLGAFELLSSPAATPQARQELLQNQALIRRGLVNAYLAPYRYPRHQITTPSEGHIYQVYRYSLQAPERLAEALQRCYGLLLSPFTYAGNRTADAEKASALYGQFFDAPLLRVEKPAIERALNSTFNRSEAKAGLADIDERRVWLAEQQVTVTPSRDWAEVELHEVYENQTADQQEILYFFSLPESAVITGLWLGETGDRSQRYAYTISPRGAAQQVYNAEVTRRQDPALLEQVGPRQYRLRAFPIPPVGQGQMHLWLTYQVMQTKQVMRTGQVMQTKQPDGWAMPELHEQRNIYWTHRTRRQLNGKAVRTQDWLPAAINLPQAQTQAQTPPKTYQMALPGIGQIVAQPLAASAYQLPQGQRFAVVIDGSYSMTAHRSQLQTTLNWLQQQVLPQNSADLYLTTAAPARPQRLESMADFDPQQAIFYGSLSPSQMLQQFLDQRGERSYDAVLLITDPGSYELTADQPKALDLSAPLWLVHLGGLQVAYDDATLAAIQNSGGGVATDLQTVMQRLGTRPSLGQNSSLLNLVDGYAWYLSRSPVAAAVTEASFTPLAARQWVTHLSHFIKPDQLQQLDQIHTITQTYGIVSPYSSMLVLVNDAQRQALKQAEQQTDRFNREVEDQQLPQPATLAVAATPEPAEWMLLLVSLVLLGWRCGEMRGGEMRG